MKILLNSEDIYIYTGTMEGSIYYGAQEDWLEYRDNKFYFNNEEITANEALTCYSHYSCNNDAMIQTISECLLQEFLQEAA